MFDDQDACVIEKHECIDETPPAYPPSKDSPNHNNPFRKPEPVAERHVAIELPVTTKNSPPPEEGPPTYRSIEIPERHLIMSVASEKSENCPQFSLKRFYECLCSIFSWCRDESKRL